ncbi:fatty acyl-CoA synthetase [Capsaspora owczarzaki ATCC 30864]|uniref:Long-chain-fatty-acid--CoA ligase n=1 Tax=Capsaspora owczarzaki (strain ATCC 30864) TaxID=595528 RepID=A0A0D2X142_CAPO3|nr:fatty acyl-CoA synthetase [Capsaspora owczarzaki ATCC 30864]KJE90154.1 fatty acyl-CoA synthetase [Capsaspora owczarzaki ATCC 30864]|eukprot:XP_004364369.1 fatty acyl-CoA synthetase [Capsaspora owczarzaki ATCC 30864]
MGAGQSHLPNPSDPSVAKQTIAVDGGNWGADAHRVPSAKDNLLGIQDAHLTTLYDNFRNSVEKYGTADCLGTRITKEDGSRGAYSFISYATASARATEVGSALVHLGLAAQTPVGIYSINRTEWVLVEQACNAYSLPTVALYDTLGAGAVRFIMNHAELPIVFCSADKAGAVLDALKIDGGVPSLKYIVTFEGADEATVNRAKEHNVTVHTFKEILELGKANPAPHRPPQQDDLAVIMYTSGTTGDPKGVMLTHKNFISTINAVLFHGVALNTDDVHFSFLPLAHSFERAVQGTILRVGASIGFFQGAIPKLAEDIQELKPTLFCGVPRVFNRFYDRVVNTVTAAGGVKLTLFTKAFAARRHALKHGQDTPFWNKLVFDKMKLILGGRVRYMITGSAPIDSKVLEFLRVCFCPVVFQGYGLTETCAASAITNYNDTLLGRVGPPLAVNEYKLTDVPDMNYFVTDKPNPRGELWIRGNNVFKGYFKDPKKTAEDLDADGWFHTGDVGMWNEDGSLSIIDRKKNIFKLAQGEYVAAEFLEGVFQKSKWILQVFVYGNSLKTTLLAVVVLDPDTIKPWAKSQGLSEDLNALAANADVQKMVLDDMTAVGKAEGLKGFEFVKGIIVESEPFAVENDLLTPTFKLRRPNATQKYKAQLEEKYKTVEP